MKSNLAVRSNLMLDDDKHRPQYRYLPGDFLKLVDPDIADVRVRDSYLTKQQILEIQQYLVCMRCGRVCAGTCALK